MTKTKTTICYVGGIGRSGSTILDMLLTQSEGVVGVGQIAGLAHDLRRKKPCRCGQPIDRCPVWKPVVERLGEVDIEKWHRVHEKLFHERYFWKFVASRKLCEQMAELSDVAFSVVAANRNARLIVDSSKNLSRALALIRSSSFPVKMVHLLRDSRGYINSVNSYRSDIQLGPILLRPSMEWIIKNCLASSMQVWLADDSYRLVRYEDLMQRPKEVLLELGEWLGCDLDGSIQAVEGGNLANVHLFSGNRVLNSNELRFQPKLKPQTLKHFSSLAHFACGGFLGRIWGY